MFLFTNFTQELHSVWQSIVSGSITLGGRIIGAMIILVIGKLIVNWINRIFRLLLEKQNVEPSVQTFLKSTVNILLLVMLGIAVVSKLGIEITGFAALLASAGVAIGVALSGNLQNVAGGLIILIFRPYKVGDYIDSDSGASGTVQEIQIFHTILKTGDNKIVYAPNGSMSNSVITNYSHQETRRVDLSFSMEYGEDYERVEQVLKDIIAADTRILTSPEPFIRLGEMADSSVNITVRVWVKSEDYWEVHFDLKKNVYTTFTKLNISIPYPQMVVHQSK
ncbi:MAG: mechanosensitive ion channel [Bacteroidaceae bacterium]|nr:mechanosensitive ion channel [Bacteroidaceae bacterium]